ncbi:hypothetical protein [Methyloradius palustris]|uniref:Uncharacterized protein n=1 Tax=Methyloradius palustris TaxID=2778876 RepID=A0A8D5G6S9_9PROT|nr:hypothetical protein [Methyloradius palustris]BCM24306.1 hypothetical protein ZMTM_05650 [Methyloradius palustris]
MKIKSCKEEYLLKAQKLSKEETERLLSRMSQKTLKRLEDLTTEEIIGIQMEIEEDQLNEWRAKMTLIKEFDIKKKSKL